MDMFELKNLGSLCTRDEPVFCQNQCPLGVDVRGLVKKIVSGDFTKAYKSYSGQVLFPEIISRICDEPCANDCLRKDIDEAVAIKMLEKACCDYTDSKDVSTFYIPPKNKSVAVIGGGLGGLSCAIMLSRKGYEVQLYEATDRLGGRLWHDNQVPPEVLEEVFIRIKSNESIKFHMNTRVYSLEDIEFNSLYIATGYKGDSFGLGEEFDPSSLKTSLEGVFMSSGASGRTHESVLIPVREGLRVSHSIETYLKVGTMSGEAGRYEVVPSKLRVDISQVELTKGVKSVASTGYSAAEAMEEAGRCLRCECRSCMTACELIEVYKKMPKKIIEDVNATLNPVKAITTRVASRQLNSCNLCGLCKEVCPTGLDFEEVFLASRRELHRSGHLPLAFHDFWVRDMEFSNSDEAFLAIDTIGQENNSKYMFFPGCQLGASDPDYVTVAYRYLQRSLEDGVSIMVGCCGAPAEWAGREEEHASVITKLENEWLKMGGPIVILACPTCEKMFGKYLPGIKVVSLWNIIATEGIQEHKRVGEGINVTVFDSCASRHDPVVRQNVRSILKDRGYQLEELQYSGEHAQCCGYGGQIHAVNPTLLDTIVKNRIKGTPYDYITYCTNCRDSFASAGKPAIHLLDLMLGGDMEERAARKPPGLSQRRENRIQLKKQLLEEMSGVKMERSTIDYSRVKVFISPELFEKMDKNLILAEDAQRTIFYCETTGNKIEDTSTGNLIGHLQNGVITYWVVYKTEGEGFRLINIYSHRLNIEEGVV